MGDPQQTLDQYTSEDMEDDSHVCPTCGETGFASEKGMKIHHARAHAESIAGVTVECDWCGAEFTRDQQTPGRDFCSEECKTDWQSEQNSGEGNPQYSGGTVTVTCKHCDEKYQVTPARKSITTFCSPDCKADWQSEHLRGENNPHYRDNTIECVCKQCGETYVVGEWKSDTTRFCSYECLGEHRKTTFSGEDNPRYTEFVTKFCETCGTEFEIKPSVADTRRFCSVECMGEWRSTLTEEEHPNYKDVSKECEWCGDVFHPQPSQAAESRFCSRECYGEWRSANLQGQDHPRWEGGYRAYNAVRSQLHGPSWNTIRETQLAESCRVCGRQEDLHLHHLVPLLSGGTNEPWNLMTLCEECHPIAEWFVKNRIRDCLTNIIKS